MDINLYKDETRAQRVMLVVDAQTVFTASELDSGGISYESAASAGSELNIGTACASTLSFTLKDFGRRIPEIQGKEIAYYSGIQTGKNRYEGIARTTRTAVICLNGGMVYAGYDKAPYLRVWKMEGERLIRQADPESPGAGVRSIIVSGNTLYCVHEGKDYLSTYNLNLVKQTNAALTPFAKDKLQGYGEKHLSLNQQGNTVTEYRVILIDEEPEALEETVIEYGQVGLFTALDPVSKDKSASSVKAYDRMVRFDKVIDNWTEKLSYPLTALAYLRGLCGYVGVPLATGTFLNSDYQIQRNYKGENVTGRQALQWIAELAAGFAGINGQGQLEIRQYREINYSITEHEIWTADVKEYETEAIDKLQIRVTENDIGVIVPPNDASKSNMYLIENNGLLYAKTDGELRPTAQKIYDALRKVTYRPYEMETAGNPFVRAGDIVSVTLDGQSFKGLILSKTWKNGKDTLSAPGEKRRAVQASPVNQSIQQLRGTVHEVISTIDEFRSDITEYQEQTKDKLGKMETSIKQNATSIAQNAREIVLKASQTTVNALGNRVAQAEASITLNAANIQLKVSTADYDSNNKKINEKFSSISQTVSSITSTVSANSNAISTVEQKVNSITSTVTGTDGSSMTKLTSDAVEMSFNGISGRGGVKVSAKGLATEDSWGDGVELYEGAIALKKNGRETIRLHSGQVWIMDMGESIGYLGILDWQGTSSYGLGIGMDRDTFMAFSFHDGYEYKTMMTLNNGGAWGKQIGVNISSAVYSKGPITAPDFIKQEVKSAKSAAYRMRNPAVEQKAVFSPSRLVIESGSGQINDGTCTVGLNMEIRFVNYQVSLTPIGGNAHISEKGGDYFTVTGDDCAFDYSIYYEESEPIQTMAEEDETPPMKYLKLTRDNKIIEL